MTEALAPAAAGRRTAALRGRWMLALGLALMAALAVAPFGLSDERTLLAGAALIFGLFALSLNLLVGTAGLPTFGHAAYFGVGAYTIGLLSVELEWNGLVALALSPLTGLVASAVLGLVVLRAQEIYFSLLTLGVAQLLYATARGASGLTGGDEGIHGVFAPAWSFNVSTLYWFTFACVAVATLVLFVVTRSPFGEALRGLRENRARAEFIGLSPKRYEYASFVIAGTLGGFAGGLFAVYQGQAFPGLLFWTYSATPLIAALLGGFRYFLGPLVGALFYTALNDELADATLYWDAVLGAVVVLVALLLPNGIVGWIDDVVSRLVSLRVRRRQEGAPLPTDAGGFARLAVSAPDGVTPRPVEPAERAARPVVLELERVSKSFGGLRATVGVDLVVREGTMHAIIGPNGAGKTTLFNLITGALRPDEGRVIFDGADITNDRSWARVKRGLGRSFQQSNVFPGLTALENVALADAAVRGVTSRFVGRVPQHAGERGQRTLESVGLGELGHLPAGELSHGDQRALEIAMALAVDAKVLCLDEPTAGVSPAETGAVMETIRRVAYEQHLTVIFVEHDMDVVFRVADWVTVLCEGSVLADGPPAEVRSNPAVVAAYLGPEPQPSARVGGPT